MGMHNLETKYLKSIDSSPGKYANRELKINDVRIFYHDKLELFLIRFDDGKVKASNDDNYYHYLKNYKDIYKLLLDLGIGHKVVNEIFLASEGSDNRSPLQFLRIYANRFRESLAFDKTDFKTDENFQFLAELARNPIMLLAEHYNKYFTEEFKELANSVPVAFANRDDGDAVSYFADADYNSEDGKVYINTVVAYTAKKGPNELKELNTFD